MARNERQLSLTNALSVSLGISSSDAKREDRPAEHTRSLSYVGFNDLSIKRNNSSKSNDSVQEDAINSETKLADQTVLLANDDAFYEDLLLNQQDPARLNSVVEEEEEGELNENSPLFNTLRRTLYTNDDIERQSGYQSLNPPLQKKASVFTVGESSSENYLAKSVQYIPSVILGLLLNILNGLSYGMIIFPITEKTFSNMGSAGLSIFYISCIVAQFVYSLGGSAFKAGVGCHMVEMIPFFHGLANNITSIIGKKHQEEIIATTITTYAVSSVITGIVFYILGKFRLGQIVGFFPRHILIGCIGGVGYFLTKTAIEVSSRLGTLEYNWDYLLQLLQFSNLIKVLIPMSLTITLLFLQHHNSNALILPTYYIFVFLITHFFILVVPIWSLPSARDSGFVFSAEGSDEVWYSYYRYYNYKIIHWNVVLQQIPSMLALTFFGILHVPINVPALAISTKQDDVDLDRELIAHGYSNIISGLVGSNQNYLVYSNTILFVRAGADSRIAGIMLGIATILVLFVGPVVIGFIPICVVGSLIFLLGFELLKEALYDPLGRVNRFEYLTIVVIVFTMGIYDFVFGIVVGIFIAAFHFIYENTKLPIISNEYTGEVARSTVIRHPLQRQFLTNVGKQIYVLKLQSFLFFGTIGKVEKTIKDLFETEKYERNPIRYLILDFKNVLNVDFSAAEGFIRIKRFIEEQNAFLIISLGDKPSILNSLSNVGIFEKTENDQTEHQTIHIFHDLNMSLEWCENEFLIKYKQIETNLKDEFKLLAPYSSNSSSGSQHRSNSVSTVRNQTFVQEAHISQRKEAILEYSTISHSINKQEKELLPLLLFALQGLSTKDEDYWSTIVKYFKREEIKNGQILKYESLESFFILIESGLFVITYHINESANIYETYLPRTILSRFENEDSTKEIFDTDIRAKRDGIVWVIDNEGLKQLREENVHVYDQLLLIVLTLNDQRFQNVAGYSLIST